MLLLAITVLISACSASKQSKPDSEQGLSSQFLHTTCFGRLPTYSAQIFCFLCALSMHGYRLYNPRISPSAILCWYGHGIVLIRNSYFGLKRSPNEAANSYLDLHTWVLLPTSFYNLAHLAIFKGCWTGSVQSTLCEFKCSRVAKANNGVHILETLCGHTAKTSASLSLGVS